MPGPQWSKNFVMQLRVSISLCKQLCQLLHTQDGLATLLSCTCCMCTCCIRFAHHTVQQIAQQHKTSIGAYKRHCCHCTHAQSSHRTGKPSHCGVANLTFLNTFLTPNPCFQTPQQTSILDTLSLVTCTKLCERKRNHLYSGIKAGGQLLHAFLTQIQPIRHETC